MKKLIGIVVMLVMFSTTCFAETNIFKAFGPKTEVSYAAAAPSNNWLDMLKDNMNIELSGIAPIYPADLTMGITGSIEVGFLFKNPLERKYFIDMIKVSGESAVGASVSLGKMSNDNGLRVGAYIRKPDVSAGKANPTFYLREALSF